MKKLERSPKLLELPLSPEEEEPNRLPKPEEEDDPDEELDGAEDEAGEDEPDVEDESDPEEVEVPTWDTMKSAPSSISPPVV